MALYGRYILHHADDHNALVFHVELHRPDILIMFCVLSNRNGVYNINFVPFHLMLSSSLLSEKLANASMALLVLVNMFILQMLPSCVSILELIFGVPKKVFP